MYDKNLATFQNNISALAPSIVCNPCGIKTNPVQAYTPA